MFCLGLTELKFVDGRDGRKQEGASALVSLVRRR